MLQLTNGSMKYSPQHTHETVTAIQRRFFAVRSRNPTMNIIIFNVFEG